MGIDFDADLAVMVGSLDFGTPVLAGGRQFNAIFDETSQRINGETGQIITQPKISFRSVDLHFLAVGDGLKINDLDWELASPIEADGTGLSVAWLRRYD
jgi:hypothetical protein